MTVQGPHGETALHTACSNGHESVVTKLLDHAKLAPDGNTFNICVSLFSYEIMDTNSIDQ